MLGAIAALALLPNLHLPNPPFGRLATSRPPEVAKSRVELPGGWRLSRTDDAFTHAVGCKLEREDVRLFAGVVTFSFGHDTDTANAIYRLDGGPLRAAGELGPEVAGHGVSYLSGDSWNPSDGRVRVPWTTLAGAQLIEIRANPKRRSRAFALDSLDAAVAVARQGGCGDLV